MNFWLLISIGILNASAWYLAIWYGHLIKRSNDASWNLFASLFSIISVSLFAIALVKLAFNSWEVTIIINCFAYISTAMAAISAGLLIRPFMYEIIHRHDAIKKKAYSSPKIKNKSVKLADIISLTQIKKRRNNE